MKRKYKYMREDFGELPVRLNHLMIYLNFVDDRVEATNCLEMTAKKQADEITLDADDLKIISVELLASKTDSDGSPLDYDYKKDQKKLIIRLPKKVNENENLIIRTRTHCFPSDTILEGIYKDITPKGAPQQYVSQCEQWGFQRIMPIIDDCRAKCTMTTTLEADAAYTRMISNGNISRTENPDGKPKLKQGDQSRQVITYENNIPMAPYLFCVLVGTWDMLQDEVVYSDGRKVRLEYLVPKGKAGQARVPMDILKKSILWIKETQDYEYTRDTYRTITMDRANIGGMENVGNTTIVTDSALVDEHTLDRGLLYAYAVIVHEFEHNQCGSEVTMETPFDMWLNEGYTVDVERQFSADQFNPVAIRQNQVESIRDPLLGPLAIEDACVAGRIQRIGFNHPDELVDGVTYVKAAEVIRMLRLILGREKFVEGKTLYFSRYKDSNASTDQFFSCFEEVSGMDLTRFKKGWIQSKGYPKVTAESSYDSSGKRCTIRFRQDPGEGNSPFHVPVELALVDKHGKDMPGSARVFHFQENEAELVIENIDEKPAFASMNRGYSFYGTFRQTDMTADEMIMQSKTDPDQFNRIEAMGKLTDIERIKLLRDPDAGISSSWLDLFAGILNDNSLDYSVRARMLSIGETPLDRRYSTWYQELVVARERLMKAVNTRYRKELVALFNSLDTYSSGSLEEGIEKRMLKSTALALIAIDDLPESHKMIIEHYRKATTANDRVTALALLNRSSSPERKKILDKVYEKWHSHLSGYANYLRVVSGGTHPAVFDEIEQEKHRDSFDIKFPTHARALVFPMAFNTKMVWTDKGLQWVTDTIIQFSSFNTTLASRLLNTFQHVKRLKPALKKKVTGHLKTILEKVKDNPVISGQANAYLR